MHSYPLLEVHNLVSGNIKSGITVIGPGNYARVERGCLGGVKKDEVARLFEVSEGGRD